MLDASDETREDRRIAPRLKPALGTRCRFDPIEGQGGPGVGLVWNISRTGVSMLLGTPPKPGAIMTGELTLEDGSAELAVMMRVIHVRPVPTGDFMLGAAFLRELTLEELKQFVDRPSHAY